MKKMRIEKQLIFADHLKAINTLHLQEAFTYQKEADGIRAIGPLHIQGEYEGNDGIESFDEVLDLDILAPYAKLKEDHFHLEIDRYQATPNDDVLELEIILNIHGLIDENEKNVVNTMNNDIEKKEEVAPIWDKELEEESKVEMKEEPLEDAFEDLFLEEESTYTSYRMIVAKANDTYTAISQRYQVDEHQLRAVNHNKDILAKTLVILPFTNNSMLKPCDE